MRGQGPGVRGCPEEGLQPGSLSTCWGGQPFSQRAAGRPGLKDKGGRGQGKELVARSLMAPKKKNIKLENYGET